MITRKNLTKILGYPTLFFVGIFILGLVCGTFIESKFLVDALQILVYPLVLFVLGYYLSTLVIYHQFKDSIGGHRVVDVARATHEFTQPNPNTSVLRNRYRYGLGVIIDDLRQMDEQGLKEGKCPLLIDKDSDRWERFDKYVRPIMNDINAYSFLAVYSPLSPLLRQLDSLTNLCRAIEIVVMELDAAFENPPVTEWKKAEDAEDYEIEIIGNANDSRVITLTNALKELSNSWQAWLKS